MQTLTEDDLDNDLDDGFALAALQPADGAAPPAVGLPVFVVVRAVADPTAGRFVVLRETPRARVFLGCTADAARRPQEWLEIWVQNAASSRDAHPTNASRDAHWRDLAAALRALDPASVLATPLENGHLPPAVLDADGTCFVPLANPWSSGRLELCTDERRLADAGLPSYAASPHRYLHDPDAAPQDARYVRLRPDAPTGAPTDAPTGGRTTDLAAALPEAAGAPTLGLDGAAVVVRRYAPLSLEEFSDVAGGQAFRGVHNARRIFRVPGVYRLLEDEDAMRCGSAHLFTPAQGRAGRLAEAIFLRLQAASQMLRAVRTQVARQQTPLLDVAADSFRVRLGATGFGLPFLWTARVDLVRPGNAYALGLGSTNERYFQSLEPLTASVYRPGFVGIALRGTANVRITKVFAPTAEGIALEGTILSMERLSSDSNDLFTLSLPLNQGVAELLGHIDLARAHSEGEAVFRTIPQRFTDAVATALPGIEGSTYTGIPFQIQSPLSTPFDLYSLGVIVLRMLVAGKDNPLPKVKDRAFSLAQEAKQNLAGGTLEERIARAFGGDARWEQSLGSRHALAADAGPAGADDALPARLWWSVLAWTLRLFPGLLPESFCKGYGDAPALALETVFDGPIRELDALLLRWRAFLLGGWRQNQEIAGVIRVLGDQT